MEPLSGRDRRTLQEMLAGLSRPVEIWAFLAEERTRHTLEEVLSQLAEISSGKVVLRLRHEESVQEALGVERLPALRVVGGFGELLPIEIVGEPTGYQFGNLVQLLVTASQAHSRLPRHMSTMVKTVTQDVLIEVLVAPTSPHAPQVMRTAQDFALANPARIFARSIDVSQFPELTDQLQAVPLLTVYSAGSAPLRHLGMIPAPELAQWIMTKGKGEPSHRRVN